ALSDEKAISENSDGQKILVAYFSWADNTEQDDIDAVTSASVTVPGNVAQLASYIAEETGGELFSIQVVEPYPADWDECLSRANQEKADGTRPELVQNVEDMEEYDVIFLGYPNWWYSCPMALLSFIESNDFSGKQIYLFCSHGTGGLARSVQDITAVLPDGNISENVFDAYEEDTAGSREDVREWLKEIH
ncbi:MAG TPA: flavodoxin, partial [Lachnospiraceae bacterium]|nr:flavodoxin [Lachnospiraceae bacterium]